MSSISGWRYTHRKSRPSSAPEDLVLHAHRPRRRIPSESDALPSNRSAVGVAVMDHLGAPPRPFNCSALYRASAPRPVDNVSAFQVDYHKDPVRPPIPENQLALSRGRCSASSASCCSVTSMPWSDEGPLTRQPHARLRKAMRRYIRRCGQRPEPCHSSLVFRTQGNPGNRRPGDPQFACPPVGLRRVAGSRRESVQRGQASSIEQVTRIPENSPTDTRSAVSRDAAPSSHLPVVGHIPGVTISYWISALAPASGRSVQ